MGKKTTKTSSTSAPPTWAQPQLQGAGQQISDVVSQNQPNLNTLSAGISSHLPGLANQAFGAQPGLAAGTNYSNNVLGGQYLNSNPYTTAMANQAGQAAGNAVNSSFSLAGRTGSDNNKTDLARGVDQAQNNVLFQNYQNERGLQNSTLGALPGMAAAQYSGVPAYLGAAQAAGTLPYSGISNLGQIGSLYNGYGTQTGTQPGGWGTQLLGAAASAAPFVFSDRRLKRDIERIGEWDGRGDGLGRYRFSYTFDPDRTLLEGVMADEVAKLRPHALGEPKNGYATVNYAELGSLA